MAVRTRDDYEAVLEALGACISTRIPVLLWGDPGSGKTSVVESAAGLGWLVETMIISHYEPSDLTGLPLLRGDHVVLAPPGWAKRLAEHDGPSIAFFDEFSTASPALQAAALRPLTHYQVGDLQLPPTVSFVAAANPADVAAAGWELAAPTASRFVHLEWGLPLEVYAECLVTGAWPVLPVGPLPDGFDAELVRQRALVAGFLRSRPSQLSVIPTDAVGRGRAFPTPRTYDYAARLAAFAVANGSSPDVVRLLVAGCVGPVVAHEFLEFARRQDLPDPEDVLAGGFLFTGSRPDRTYVVLQSVLAAVQRKPTARRWTAAVDACGRAAADVGVDAAVPVVRALLRPGARPAGAALPASITVFAPVLALAGLLPGA
ncbi:ATP-binding protein [Cellulomonas composti]|uniref:ATPase AAA n=1 Tax=Cellulomonas composti TaxID=266130 RepID=A0A511JEG2_9CELL|nr:AAA family ATPase [Cellulomonas composti]GEL96355.1 ATPase AAA [Cellulomonas composti]